MMFLTFKKNIQYVNKKSDIFVIIYKNNIFIESNNFIQL